MTSQSNHLKINLNKEHRFLLFKNAALIGLLSNPEIVKCKILCGGEIGEETKKTIIKAAHEIAQLATNWDVEEEIKESEGLGKLQKQHYMR